MRKIVIFILLFLSGLICLSQNKIALVIGNSDYKEMPLKNPRNDAYDLSVTLRSLGFEVIQKTDLNRRGMEDAIREFKGKISPGDVALFYFSGHGTQVAGLNYLIPVKESVSNEIDVKYNCVEAGFVLDHMEQARSGINIIILDACRNNPFKGYRSANRGFAFMSAPTGSIIAYSTAPGSVAQDGDGRNSPFTKNLIEKIKMPGLKIEEVFKEVRKDVANETGRRQIPWESSSLMGDFYFKRGYSPHESFMGNSGIFTDTRDGQRYRWVRIGKQIWMAENLNYKIENSWCYDNDKSNCEKYGRLYKWDAAMKACPSGWYLPSDEEWKILEGIVDSQYPVGDPEWNDKEWRGYNAGINLKSKSGWYNNQNGIDKYFFSILPSGLYSGLSENFEGITKYLGYWTSSEISKNFAVSRTLRYDKNNISRNTFNSAKKFDGFSVRCIKN